MKLDKSDLFVKRTISIYLPDFIVRYLKEQNINISALVTELLINYLFEHGQKDFILTQIEDAKRELERIKRKLNELEELVNLKGKNPELEERVRQEIDRAFHDWDRVRKRNSDAELNRIIRVRSEIIAKNLNLPVSWIEKKVREVLK